MPASGKSATRTRARLLRAAERCFADYGYDGTSLRQITRMAGVNLAAVNYHFASKRELWLDTMQRRIAPLNAERMRLLEALRAATPRGQPLSIEKVCEAMFLPMARMGDGSPSSGFACARLVGQVFMVPQPLMRELNRRNVDQFWRVFNTALRDALPGIPPSELEWKFFFMMAAFLGALGWQGRQPGMARPLTTADLEAMMRRLSTFVSHGLRDGAPAKR